MRISEADLSAALSSEGPEFKNLIHINHGQISQIKYITEIVKSHPAHKEAVFQKIKSELALEGTLSDCKELVELYPEYRKEFFEMMISSKHFEFHEAHFEDKKLMIVEEFIKIFPDLKKEMFQIRIPAGHEEVELKDLLNSFDDFKTLLAVFPDEKQVLLNLAIKYPKVLQITQPSEFLELNTIFPDNKELFRNVLLTECLDSDFTVLFRQYPTRQEELYQVIILSGSNSERYIADYFPDLSPHPETLKIVISAILKDPAVFDKVITTDATLALFKTYCPEMTFLAGKNTVAEARAAVKAEMLERNKTAVFSKLKALDRLGLFKSSDKSSLPMDAAKKIAADSETKLTGAVRKANEEYKATHPQPKK